MRVLAARFRLFLSNLFGETAVIYAERGIAPFRKPILLSLPALLALYAAVYSPVAERLSEATVEVSRIAAVEGNYKEYTEAREKLSAYHSRLPMLKDKDEWLSRIITDSAQKAGLSIDSMLSQQDTETDGFVFVSREVTVTADYAAIGAWLAEIENSPILLRVTQLMLKRTDARPGVLQCSCRLATVFPLGENPE